MTRIQLPLLPALLALLLPACTTSGDFPSLARRDAERIKGTAEPAPAAPLPPAPPPSPPGAELSARLRDLVAQARAANGRFAERRPRGEQLVAAGRGTSQSGEAWALASVALADLESARSEAMIALAELDQLHAAESIANPNQPTGSGIAIIAARDQVMAWIGEQDAVLAALQARLAG